MKRLLLSATALLALSVGALAADLPRRSAPGPIYAPIPVFTWTGFYVGVNAGYGWGNDNTDNGGCGFGTCFGNLSTPIGVGQFAPVVPAFANAFPTGFAGNGGNNDGFVGGAQIGFNYQFTPGSGLVVGVEADIQWADFGNNNNNNGFFGNGFGTAAVTPNGPGLGVAPVFGLSPGNVAFFNNGGIGRSGNGNDWFGTVRGRVGWAFDRVLVYATGGIAFTDGGNNNRFFGGGVTNGSQIGAPFYVSPAAAAFGATVGTGGFFGRNSNNDVGWVLGGGAEWAFTNNLTFKIEGLWVNFDNNKNNTAFGNVVGVTNQGAPILSPGGFGFGGGNNSDDVFIARVGVNYKFGS